MRRLLALAVVLAALSLAGCVEVIALAASTTLGGVAVFQRYEDRQAQRDQNKEIKALREELARTRKVLEERLKP